MKLLDHERKSPVWAKVKEYLESELAALRERNDGNLDPIMTAHLRGRLKQIKEILLLNESSPAEQEPDDAA